MTEPKAWEYPDAAAFMHAAEPFLLADEARHQHLLSTAAALLRRPDLYPGAPFLTTLEDGGRVVAAALRTPPQDLILAAGEPPPPLAPLLDLVLRRDPDTPGVTGPTEAAGAFAAAWSARTRRPHRRTMAERFHRLTAVRPLPPVPGAPRRAGPVDRALVVAWATAFHAEAMAGFPAGDVGQYADRRLSGDTGELWFWEDGAPRAMAGSGVPTPGGVRIGAVYTPPEFRRRGYATALVAALSQDLLDRGHRRCYLFTDLANPTSNRIYRAIGYEPVFDVDRYSLG